MRQVKPQSRSRRKRCANCRDLFDPDPRAKGRQKYCFKSLCQDHRQRLNEKNWREKNPDCLAYQQGQSRAWHKARPDYSRKRRASDSALTMGNRIQTRFRMRNQRFRRAFDKSKPILTQIIGKIRDKCCLISGQWLYLRLTKASPLSKPWRVRHTGQRLKRIFNRLPRGRLYDLSGLFNGGFL